MSSTGACWASSSTPMAARWGCDRWRRRCREGGTLEDVIEPYLIQQGFLKFAPRARGRMATPKAYRHLGFKAKPMRRSCSMAGEPFVANTGGRREEHPCRWGGLSPCNIWRSWSVPAVNGCAAGRASGRLERDADLVFVVRALQTDFRAPARLDDQLSVSVALLECRGASFVLAQRIERNGALLVEATVKIASLCASTFRPSPIPGFLLSQLHLLPEAS